MLFDILAHTLSIFLRHRKTQIADDSDLVHLRKRLLLHKDIPDLETVKRITGIRFNKLQQIFNRHDPVNKRSEKLSRNPNKYELITRTVIYKLPNQKTREAIADMLYVEFSLYFKHAYNKYEEKEQLINEINNFRKTHFTTNPFQP